MNIRKINRAVHRDLGYFFFGMCIIYGISGVALNHRHQWNPNYEVVQKDIQLPVTIVDSTITKEQVVQILNGTGEGFRYKTHLLTEKGIRIFIEGGTLDWDANAGIGKLELLNRRPVFSQLNFLHYNTPRKLWTWFSDAFSVSLILIAVSGLFVIKGKNGITGRGAWLTIAGLIIPITLLFIYLNA